MVKKIGKVKKQVKASTRENKKLEAESHDVPRTMIFCKSGSGPVVRQLVEDFKSIMEPYTTTTLKCTKKNKMKDFIDHAGPLNVKNIIYFTETVDSKKTPVWNESTNFEIGGVYCHIICVPHGPTFTYKLKEYSLKKDIQNANGFCMNSNWLQQPPLIVLHGFGSLNSDHYLKAVTSSWQNMLPNINVNKTRIRTLRRAVLLSRQTAMPGVDEKIGAEWGEVFVLRHYNIKLENKELSKSVRKLGVGAASRNTKVPNLSKFASMEDFVTGAGAVSESDMSDVEEPTTVELVESMRELPGSSGKTAIKMMEVGPRITMQLLKIEAGVHDGAVLYHRYIKRTAEEVFELEKRREQKLRLKDARRKEQEKNVAEKKKNKVGADKKMKKKKNDDDSGSEGSLVEGGEDEEATKIDVVEGEDVEEVEEEMEEKEDESEGIEDINDSMDEDDGSEGLKDVEESEGSCEEDDDCEEDDEEDFEEIDDSMDEDDIISDLEDGDNSDLEMKEDVKKMIQTSQNTKKRSLPLADQKNNKKRKV